MVLDPSAETILMLEFVISFIGHKTFSAIVCTHDIDIGYNVKQMFDLAPSKAKSNWEWGNQAQVSFEFSSPFIAVLSDTVFPNGAIPKQAKSGMIYAKRRIKTSGNTLTAAGGMSMQSCIAQKPYANSTLVNAGDPTSLGVAAILLGQSDSSTFSAAATRQVQ